VSADQGLRVSRRIALTVSTSVRDLTAAMSWLAGEV